MRRTPVGFEQEEEKHLQSMLKAQVIQPSNSPWASPPVLIRKKDGSVRWCLDFRKLNEVTLKDAFPLPLISECLDTLSGNTYMSTLDMAAGYWQLEIHPEDRHKTAFLTKYGLFEFVRMPFGLCNAPSTFQRAINLVLRGLTWKTVLAFLDDVLVLGRDFEDHLNNLREVLGRFRRHRLKLKPKKCALFRTRVKFLGKIVSKDGVEVDEDSISAVRDWPVPRSTREVESFLGFLNYHRDHLPKLAEVAQPLYSITGKKTPFIWGDAQESAFNELKSLMVSPPVLAFPCREGMFMLDTDASETAIGAVLSQSQGDQTRIIAYGSKALTPPQRKYCTTRKELLALVAFTRQYRHYLLGRHFTARTDHSSLAWLMRFKNLGGQLARWMEELSQYDIQVVHRPGKDHTNADALSRVPAEEEFCNCYEAGRDLSTLPCGGCAYCVKAHKQWSRFEEDVDDVVPLAYREARISVVQSAVSSNWASSWSDQDLRDAQEQDEDLRVILQWMEREEYPTHAEVMAQSPKVKKLWSLRDLLEVRGGLLYYHWQDNAGQRDLLVVPRSLQARILELGHSNLSAGHMGIGKTLKRLRQRYFWPGQQRDTQLFVKGCASCNRSKHPTRRNRAPLTSYVAGAPMERVHMDILGPLPQSRLGHRYILLMVDQFTKWVEAVALPDQSAETVARAAVDTLFSHLGYPLLIHTDQGTNFTSQLFSELCKLLHIIKTRTTPYRPCSNGQVERINRTILQMVRCTLQAKQVDWDRELQVLMGAIRSTENRSTGFTPNFLMLGREVNTPLQLMVGAREGPKGSTADYVASLQASMERAHLLARKNLGQQQQRQKKAYDLRASHTSYEVGDIVSEINSAAKVGESRKLAPIWKGPYLVTDVVSPILVRVKGRSRERIVHTDRLRLCRDRTLPLWLRRERNRLLRDADGQDVECDPRGSNQPTAPTLCVCDQPDDGRLMIACDSCNEWFHGNCVGVTEEDAKRLDLYCCPVCTANGLFV
nr:hypothetical protein BaRGS_013533 [Batillaria attramentaria]